MQYVGQTCCKLKTRYDEHYRKLTKPRKIDTFLYQHFNCIDIYPTKVFVQPVETLFYDKNSSVRFN